MDRVGQRLEGGAVSCNQSVHSNGVDPGQAYQKMDHSRFAKGMYIAFSISIHTQAYACIPS